MINVTRQHRQHWFLYMKTQTKNQEKIRKQIAAIFSALHITHEVNFIYVYFKTLMLSV